MTSPQPPPASVDAKNRDGCDWCTAPGSPVIIIAARCPDCGPRIGVICDKCGTDRHIPFETTAEWVRAIGSTLGNCRCGSQVIIATGPIEASNE